MSSSPNRRQAALAAVAAPVGWLLPGRAQAQAAAEPSTPLPESFGLDTPLGRDGEGRDLTRADLASRVLVVCFWATWCPYCRTELTILENMQRKVPPEQLRVVMVNTESERDWRRMRSRIEAQLSPLFTHDTEGRVGRAFVRPNSVPYTVVIGREGDVRARQQGWGDGSVDFLVEHVNAALKAPRQS